MTFEFSNGEPDDLQQAIGESLGAASVAWTESPRGVFEDGFALEIQRKLTGYIEEHYEPKGKPWVWRLVKVAGQAEIDLQVAPELTAGLTIEEVDELVKRIAEVVAQAAVNLLYGKLEED